tara:strand:+ start:35 stop:583 length:549 start_codon:yes stop_codon:yes gene_type:complete
MEGPPRNILSFILSELNSQIELGRENIQENIQENKTEKTSKEFIEALEEIEMDKPDISCSICLEDFNLGDKCIKLPCKDHPHYFHNEKENCMGIKKWLEKSNTCPVCRTEFPKESEHETTRGEEETEGTEEDRIIQDMDNRVQFLLNSVLSQGMRVINPRELIEMEEQRQIDLAIRTSLEDQ